MKAMPITSNAIATVTGVQTYGVSLGLGRDNWHLTTGWEDRRKIAVGTDASVGFEWPERTWPSGDFFRVRITTNIPPALLQSSPTSLNASNTIEP